MNVPRSDKNGVVSIIFMPVHAPSREQTPTIIMKEEGKEFFIELLSEATLSIETSGLEHILCYASKRMAKYDPYADLSTLKIWE